jgi:hypothetical protein
MRTAKSSLRGQALVLAFSFAIAPVIAHGQTVASFTPGSFDVSPSGAATYTIPIQVPPGIAGIEPKLALTYSSQSGNGLLGVGWALSGLSAIQRCPRTIAQDRINGGVSYDANDRFCLDGQRLIAINGADGADQTEYRTEVETFTKVVSYGVAGSGPAWFKVWTKSGQIMEYGSTADSRIEIPSSAVVRVWAVKKIYDVKGNFLTVTYTEDTLNGGYLPSRIDYTGNGAQAPSNSVQFTPEMRNDWTSVPFEGPTNTFSSIWIVKRLQKISTFVGSSPTPVREYKIGYDNGGYGDYGGAGGPKGASRVISVTECVGDGSCAVPITFSYPTSGNGSITDSGRWATTATFGGSTYTWAADFDGDGRIDIASASGTSLYLYLGMDTGFFSPVGPTTVPVWGSSDYTWLGDFNGDGIMDIATASGTNLYLYLGGHGGFTVVGPITVPGWGGPGYNFVGDFNGDGKMDIAAASGSNLYLYLGLAGTAGFSVATTATVPAWGGVGYNFVGDFDGDGLMDIAAYSGTSLYLYRGQGGNAGFGVAASPTSIPAWGGVGYNFTGDFNGDGKSDIAAAVGSLLYLYLGNDSGGFTQSRVTNNTTWGSTDYVWTGDFNGDGKIDIATAVGNSLYLYYGTTASGFSGFVTTVPGWGGAGYNFVGDFNGDGRKDIAAASGSNLYLYLGRGDGNGFIVAPTTTAPEWGSQGFNFSGDFNGDGKSDIVALIGSNMRVYQGGPAFTSPNLITSVTNGLGAVTTIDYSVLTYTSLPRVPQWFDGHYPAAHPVYTKDQTAAYPIVDLQNALYVVSSAAGDDGGSNYRTNYAYAGAKADQWGRGFLGFRTFTGTDIQSGITTTSTFHQDFPFTGMPSRMERTYAGSAYGGTWTGSLSRVDNTLSAIGLGGSRYFPFVNQSIASANDLNGATLPTVITTNSYDLYGNPTQIWAWTGDGSAKITNNTFSNDTANWFLGRLTRSTVTSSVNTPQPPILTGTGGPLPPAPPPAPPVPLTPAQIAAVMTIINLLLSD